MDPAEIRTLSQLADALGEMRRDRSLSLRGLADAAAKLPKRDERQPTLPPTTASDLLNAKSVPEAETVATFLAACGIQEKEAQRPWLQALERVATQHQRRPPGAVRVRDARPRMLGVHAAIRTQPTEHELPAYVPRDFDAELCSAIIASASDGGFVLLTGGSSVGKTRALFEAVKSTLPDWWLIQPSDTDAIITVADAPNSRTLIWLDELQRYLNHPGGLPVSIVRRLVTAGLVLVATLWPDEYGVRTVARQPGKRDLHANDRELLGLAEVIDVPAVFSPDERSRAATLVGDRRIRIALDTADVGVTQVLAAGPELVRRWEHAPASQCYGKAVITSALDARRLGVLGPLTAHFLSSAAPDYLTPAEQANAPTDWFDQALDYATKQLRGATGALMPTSGDRGMGETSGYLVADYLLQHVVHARRFIRIPASAWCAMATHVCNVDDAARVGTAARCRMRFSIAVPLLQRAFDAGNFNVTDDLIDSLFAINQKELASAVLERYGARYSMSWTEGGLYSWRAGRGDVAEVAEFHIRDEWDAAQARADLFINSNQGDDYLLGLEVKADEGDRDAAKELACILSSREDLATLRKRAYANDGPAWKKIVELHLKRGNRDAAVSALWTQLEGGWLVADRLGQLMGDTNLGGRLRAYGLNPDGTIARRPCD